MGDIAKYKYQVKSVKDDTDSLEIIEFIPVESPENKSEGDPRKEMKKPFVQEAADPNIGGHQVSKQVNNRTKNSDVISTYLKFNFEGSKSGKEEVDFIPVDLTRKLSNKMQNTNKLTEILSNEIPRFDLMHENDTFSNSTDKSLTFLPVTVTTKKRLRKNKEDKSRKLQESSTENELTKLLIAVENMSELETRKAIIKKNQEKRRKRKKMQKRRREEKRRRAEKKRRGAKEINSSLPPDGYFASNSAKNFLKKKYYRSEPQILVPEELAEHKKSSLYAQILASYKTQGVTGTRKRLRKRRKRRSINCRMSQWGEWGDCNKSCGIGESERRREVIQPPSHGGRPCSHLIDHRWCGSARNCKTGYFKW